MSDTIIMDSLYGISLKNDMKFEHIIAQIQPLLTEEILCIKNGMSLVIFKKRSEFPIGLKLESVNDDMYYLRSLVNGDMYAIAGKDTASIFFPEITNGGVRYASINNMGHITSEISQKHPKASIRRVPL